MKKRAPLSERFERFFTRGSSFECWEWTGQKCGSGYGMIRSAGQGSPQFLSHRLAWEIANGEKIPSGLVVMHSCDNRACVNPDHLRIGTYKDNSLDMLSKGRQSKGPGFKGVSHPRAKLNEDQVRSIRSSFETQTALAATYGVTQTLISQIKSRKCWQHLE